MLRSLAVLVALPAVLSSVACAPASSAPARTSTTGVAYVRATDDGGVVQAGSEDAAEEQMRGRCPGGYSIVQVEPVPIGSFRTTQHGYFGSSTHTRVVVQNRYTYACTRFRSPVQGATST